MFNKYKLHLENSSSLIINNNDIKELLKELYIIVLNREFSEYNIIRFIISFINNFLLEYDLNPKDVFEIMINNSKNNFYYSSLIGFFYQYGIGCEINKIKSFEIFSNTIKNSQSTFDPEIASYGNDDNFDDDDYFKNLNEMISQYLYSLILYNDVIVPRRNKYELHIKQAEKGDPVSQYYIGAHCHYVKRDFSEAIEWYSKSSKEGNIKAMYELGLCYYNGSYNIAKDKERAFELFLKSADKGYKCAIHKLGDCYNYGHGVLKDESKAFEYYLNAAKKGNIECQNLVSDYYNNGKCIPKDEEKGFYWMRKSAINGNILAQYNLHSKNESKAFKWYLKLANENRFNAFYLVARCYRDAIGTNRDLREAEKWFKKYSSKKEFITLTLKDFLSSTDI